MVAVTIFGLFYLKIHGICSDKSLNTSTQGHFASVLSYDQSYLCVVETLHYVYHPILFL